MSIETEMLLRGIAEKLESLQNVLEHHAEILREISDTGNNEVPGLVANGAENVMRWVSGQMEDARKRLTAPESTPSIAAHSTPFVM